MTAVINVADNQQNDVVNSLSLCVAGPTACSHAAVLAATGDSPTATAFRWANDELLHTSWVCLAYQRLWSILEQHA